MEPKIAFTAAQVAGLLGLSLVTIRRATAAGVLPCRRLGTAVRYTRADIDTYLDAHADGGGYR